MKQFGQKICLSMIVKNEAHVIRRCLASVRPIIDHWIIVDTGSTDGTQDVIRAIMADMPGSLVERPWVDFAHNRNEALRLARPHGTYSLIIDADDELLIPAGFLLPKLNAPGYDFTIIDGPTTYSRPQLVNNKFNWYYRGVLHEFLDCHERSWRDPLPLSMRRGEDGARHRDETTYSRDAAILEKALTKEKDPFLIARYTFYLAQSYRDFGEARKARDLYLKRADLGYWDEEVYISLFSAALQMDKLGEPEERVLAVYDRAISICPNRVEVRYAASRYCRQANQHIAALNYAEAGLGLQLPGDGLFLQPWMYHYGIQDEYAVASYNTGQYRACLSTCLGILDRADLPSDVRSRIVALSREALVKMLDPVWGFNQSAYRSEFMPLWQL
ncbi:glycosyltransferase [Methylobacterium sp. P1-11]|uniref:tetratricopeptide repeat-containing glycosyltransferase n=1 Tax=Methylobacterium sp. P1-11 TaxID=2024616 RepID=UPI0011EEF2E5|nr:glycosyltransferase [Methylobacterium sp. P1-11]KAA0124699.1 glycosyltransferase [Methylobacterium sp. P1-11]